jgi:electron transfer flavoprotein alpha subunit
MAKILVVAELGNGTLKKTTLSAITFARTAAQGTSGSFDILALGAGAESVAAQLAGFGAGSVLVGDDAYLANYVGERYSPTVAAVAKSGYDVVVITASAFGKDLAPRVAARLEAGFASDISRVEAEGAKLSYKRPMYAGNAIATMAVTTAVQVVTVRQAEFEAAAPSGGSSAVSKVAIEKQASAERVEFIAFEESVKSARPELSEASAVVSGGRALKSAEGFKTVLEPLVDAFGAAIGATRAVVRRGLRAQ